ncbi:hypothetical protein F5884DRAFT_818653 [Xylogone sp. PMI_703]|nr:hypothetical protein F5884DRAFT_818653 [Xylogone sp. PMI_703]
MTSKESDRVILITGAGNGIGLAIVNTLLSSHQARIMAVDIDGTHLWPLISKYPGYLEVLVGDVSSREVNECAVERAISTFGHLDVIILNAGILKPVGTIAETKVSDWKRLFDVNFFALLHAIQIALPHLRSRNGNIIMTSSGVSVNPYPAWVAYASSKRAMNGLCAGLKLEEPDISCICITPGIANTGMQKEVREEHENSLPSEQYQWLNNLYKAGKLLSPDQPASAFAKLALNGIPKKLSGQLIAWDDAQVV